MSTVFTHGILHVRRSHPSESYYAKDAILPIKLKSVGSVSQVLAWRNTICDDLHVTLHLYFIWITLIRSQATYRTSHISQNLSTAS